MSSPLQARYKPSKLLLIGLIIVLVGGLGFAIGYLFRPSSKEAEISQGFTQAQVVRVIDGDTIELEGGKRVRYLGIDTPESGEPFSDESTSRNKELVEGKTVEMQVGKRDVDEYGRMLRYIYVDGTFVNAEMVTEGYAKAYIFDPNDRYSQVLVQLEQYAKLQKKGIWGTH